MDNLEAVLQSLNDFERAKEKSIGPELDHLLSHIAKTGRTEFPWHLLKPLIAHKLERVLEDFFENNPSTNVLISEPTSKPRDFYPDAQKLVTILNCFVGTPFTIQRICELITEPKRYYKTKDKFLRGIEKNIMVVSTVQPDGSLITRNICNLRPNREQLRKIMCIIFRRSIPTVLTNGDISPTKMDTVPTPPNVTPLNNWLLSCLSNTPDHALNTSSTAPEITAEEKPKTQSSEENSVDTDTSSNTTPNSDDKTEQLPVTDDVPPSENAEDASDTKENIVDQTSMDNVENCVENGTNEQTIDATEKADAVANIETPAEEKGTPENDKMEES